jgi:hypothetical protein
MKHFFKGLFIFAISSGYLYVEYFYRERLLQISSDFGYSLDYSSMETLGRTIAAFGLTWFVFLVMRARNRLPNEQAIPLYVGVSMVIFFSFYHVQRLGVDWYVDNMSLEEKHAAVGAQTFKAFTYYQEKSGDGGYNPNGDMGFVDKLMLSFLPWVAYDNDSIRQAMSDKLILAAQSNVRNDVKFHAYKYSNIQQGVSDRLYSMSLNYIGSLNAAPSGVNYVLAPERLQEKIDETHWNINTLAVKSFRAYRASLLSVYTGNVPHQYKKYSTINGNYYTRSFEQAKHSRLTPRGLIQGDWLLKPPTRSIMQEMTKKFTPFLYPVSKIEALFVNDQFKPLVVTKKDLQVRVDHFQRIGQDNLSQFSHAAKADKQLLSDYRAQLLAVNACRRYETPAKLSRDYAHTWDGQGHYFVQNHKQWVKGRKNVSALSSNVLVTMHSAVRWEQRPLRYGMNQMVAARIEDAPTGASVTVCDPYHYQPVFDRFVYPLMVSINRSVYHTKSDMITYAQFARSAYWKTQLPDLAKRQGFTVSQNFAWRSKSAIKRLLITHAERLHQEKLEDYMLSALADFSTHYDRAMIDELYASHGVKLPLWRVTRTTETVRKVMSGLSKQPVVKAVLKKEYPFLYDAQGRLLILYLYKGEGRYADIVLLNNTYMTGVADMLSANIKQKLLAFDEVVIDQQVRAFIVVPLSLLLSTLFILLNAINIVFLLLSWTSLSSTWLKVFQFAVVFVVLALPMISDNEYKESGFYQDYLSHGSSPWTIQMTVWLQGSAAVFDGLNTLMGKRQYKKGKKRIKKLAEP